MGGVCATNANNVPAALEVTDADVRPDFEFFKGFLPEALCQSVRDGLTTGPDPSSQHFAERSKAILFLTVINGKVQSFSQDYFVQNSDYNDFSGGYQRRYSLIPEDLCKTTLADIVLKFTEYFQIPEKTVLLMQIQTSTIKSDKLRASITGQGIHTDGADRAMLLCLHRGCDVEGALNQFHGSLDGSSPLCEPTELKPGDAVMFKDNKIYHYVTPAQRAPPHEGLRAADAEPADAERTILLVHSPAEMYMQGLPNTSNTLGCKEVKVKLRDEHPSAGP